METLSPTAILESAENVLTPDFIPANILDMGSEGLVAPDVTSEAPRAIGALAILSDENKIFNSRDITTEEGLFAEAFTEPKDEKTDMEWNKREVRADPPHPPVSLSAAEFVVEVAMMIAEHAASESLRNSQ